MANLTAQSVDDLCFLGWKCFFFFIKLEVVKKFWFFYSFSKLTNDCIYTTRWSLKKLNFGRKVSILVEWNGIGCGIKIKNSLLWVKFKILFYDFSDTIVEWILIEISSLVRHQYLSWLKLCDCMPMLLGCQFHVKMIRKRRNLTHIYYTEI